MNYENKEFVTGDYTPVYNVVVSLHRESLSVEMFTVNEGHQTGGAEK